MLVKLKGTIFNTDDIASVSKIYDNLGSANPGIDLRFEITGRTKEYNHTVYVSVLDFFLEEFPKANMNYMGAPRELWDNPDLIAKYKPLVLPKIQDIRDELLSHWGGGIEAEIPVMG